MEDVKSLLKEVTERKDIKTILSLYDNKVSIPIISISLDITEEKVKNVIEKQDE